MANKIIRVSDFSEVEKYNNVRFYYQELKKYVYDENNFKVLALFGLKGTGKSISMLQLANELYKNSNIYFSYYVCGDNVVFDELDELLEIDFNKNVKLVFVDNITRIKDFIECSTILVNYYISQGMKFIITGDDSLNLLLASYDRLYDKIQMINTNYISFGEFNHLLDKGLEEYIRYGGVLDENFYYSDASANNYKNSAIIKNIISSLENNEELRIYPPTLTEVYDNSIIEENIDGLINNTIYNMLNTTTEIKVYKSEDMNISSIEDLEFYLKVIGCFSKTKPLLLVHHGLLEKTITKLFPNIIKEDIKILVIKNIILLNIYI